MTFKGESHEDLVTYYSAYSHAVDTSLIVTINREEYLALNMLRQVGPVRQKKILEKTSKPKLNEILYHINSEITVDSISQGLKTKDKKGNFKVEDKSEKVLRVEDENCYKCNQRGHIRSTCRETDERKFHCSHCNIYGHERTSYRKYKEEEMGDNRRSSSHNRSRKYDDGARSGSSREDDRRKDFHDDARKKSGRENDKKK